MKIITRKLKKTVGGVEKRHRTILSFLEFPTQETAPAGYLDATGEAWCYQVGEGTSAYVMFGNGDPNTSYTVHINEQMQDSYWQWVHDILKRCQKRLRWFEDDDAPGNWEGDEEVTITE